MCQEYLGTHVVFWNVDIILLFTTCYYNKNQGSWTLMKNDQPMHAQRSSSRHSLACLPCRVGVWVQVPASEKQGEEWLARCSGTDAAAGRTDQGEERRRLGRLRRR